jgi:hypothetical protein
MLRAAASSHGFGPGTLGAWRSNARVISSSAHVRHVVATNEVVLFGDSIAVQDGEALGRLLSRRLGTTFAEHSWAGQPRSAAVDAMAAWASAWGTQPRVEWPVSVRCRMQHSAGGSASTRHTYPESSGEPTHH